MFEPRIPAIGASIGFVLSLLVGIFSGASFFVVFARAAGMGLLFGVFAVLSRIIILRFIPELAGGPPPEAAAPQDTGNAVDITIGEFGKDENPFETPINAAEDNMMPDFLGAAAPLEAKPSAGRDEPRQQGDSSAGSPREADQGNGRRAAPPPPESPRSIGGLDVLPDLQDFIPQVAEAEEDDENGESSLAAGMGMGNSLYSAPDASGSSAEAETMVKAIRTILAKDS